MSTINDNNIRKFLTNLKERMIQHVQGVSAYPIINPGNTNVLLTELEIPEGTTVVPELTIKSYTMTKTTYIRPWIIIHLNPKVWTRLAVRLYLNNNTDSSMTELIRDADQNSWLHEEIGYSPFLVKSGDVLVMHIYNAVPTATFNGRRAHISIWDSGIRMISI